jgi:hypothetical protein
MTAAVTAAFTAALIAALTTAVAAAIHDRGAPRQRRDGGKLWTS